jgi:hypothetical protein
MSMPNEVLAEEKADPTGSSGAVSDAYVRAFCHAEYESSAD